MPNVFHLTINELVNTYFPNAVVTRTRKMELIKFSWFQIISRQDKILAIWRKCNYYHLKPVAKTFLGRISSIEIMYEGRTSDLRPELELSDLRKR